MTLLRVTEKKESEAETAAGRGSGRSQRRQNFVFQPRFFLSTGFAV